VKWKGPGDRVRTGEEGRGKGRHQVRGGGNEGSRYGGRRKEERKMIDLRGKEESRYRARRKEERQIRYKEIRMWKGREYVWRRRNGERRRVVTG
jgi:hypothetical protein